MYHILQQIAELKRAMEKIHRATKYGAFRKYAWKYQGRMVKKTLCVVLAIVDGFCTILLCVENKYC